MRDGGCVGSDMASVCIRMFCGCGRDIKIDFPATDYVGNQHYVFNIRGNRCRLIVVVKFTIGYIFIRKVCTRDEYDKLDCSTL